MRGILAEGNFLRLISEVRSRLDKTARRAPEADRQLELFGVGASVGGSMVELFCRMSWSCLYIFNNHSSSSMGNLYRNESTVVVDRIVR